MILYTIPPLIAMTAMTLPSQQTLNEEQLELSDRVKTKLSDKNIKGRIVSIKSETKNESVIFSGSFGETIIKSTEIKMFDECPNIIINDINKGIVKYSVAYNTDREQYGKSNITICINDTIASLIYKTNNLTKKANQPQK